MNTRHNWVHGVIDRPPNRSGLEIKCNWRYWAIGFSWGDALEWRSGNGFEVWFIGLQLGPLIAIYSWDKTPQFTFSYSAGAEPVKLFWNHRSDPKQFSPKDDPTDSV